MAKLSSTDIYGDLYVDGNISEKGTSLAEKYAALSHGTHLTLGTGSGNAFRGDYGNTAYNHSQAAHAPSNAQKNSDITKAEIEAKLTGTITSHNHSSLTGVTSLSFKSDSSDTASISTTVDGTNTYFDFNLADDSSQNDTWRWRFTPSGGTLFDAMTLDANSNTTAKLIVLGNITATSFTENGTSLAEKYAAKTHTHDGIMFQDTRAVNTTPDGMPKGLSVHLKSSGADGINEGGSYHTSLMLKGWNDYSGGPWSQLTITGSNNLWFRSSSSATAWNAWKKVSVDGHTHTTVNGYTIWVGTQAQYDAISSKSSTTIYFVKS